MKSGPFRLSASPSFGTAVRRDRPVRFRFDAKAYTGLQGDTLASALLANGVRTVARSFKFHRPRGIYSAGLEEPNAFVQLGRGAQTVTSVRATLIDLHEDLEAWSRARRRFDPARLLDATAQVWAAGFYNKTFIWPAWHVYEGFIRRMAGFGRPANERDPDRYEHRNLHCDVLVIGGGEAGLRSAHDAADRGARVVLVEHSNELGGRAGWQGAIVEGEADGKRVRDLADRLAHRQDVRLLTRTTAVGYHERDVVTLLERSARNERSAGSPGERLWVVRAKQVVLATGAIEQPLVFCNNDRPGILLASAAQEYLRKYAVACGRRVIVATNNDTAYALAFDLKQAGVHVLAVADSRPDIAPLLRHKLAALSVPLLERTVPMDTRGLSHLRGVSLAKLSSDSQRIERVREYACDALAISGGWNPNLHLYSQAGGKLQFNPATHALSPVTSGAFWPATRHPSIELAGSVGRPALSEIGPRICPVGKTHRHFVDLRHDVTVADLELAAREGFTSMEHIKRYTTLGMAADQGKTSNLAGLEIAAGLRGLEPSQVGHTTFRPPFVPVTLGAIAARAIGPRFAPMRLLPMHDWHVAHGAIMQNFSGWQRPVAYLRAGESRPAAVLREMRTVRSEVGLLDYSPLGKIEVRGPDALNFLNRFYINDLTTLKPNRVRYCLMLRESGVIFDDGTVVMLAADHFIVTTTSGNAQRVAAWFEEWHQCEWPHLKVTIVPVTEAWACLSLSGPRAREVLTQLSPSIDLATARLPHLGMQEGRLLDFAVRLYRVSFTGELTYEINVEASGAQVVWDALLEAGAPYGLAPFGLDALQRLRLEKGFLHVGTDTDGTTVPDDVGWGRVAANKGCDYIGKRSLTLSAHRRDDRLQLVGLTSKRPIIVGSHLRLAGSRDATDGWVTSAGVAALTGEPIALAMLRGGRACKGASVSVHGHGRVTQASVVTTPFYDPSGVQMNA